MLFIQQLTHLALKSSKNIHIYGKLKQEALWKSVYPITSKKSSRKTVYVTNNLGIWSKPLNVSHSSHVGLCEEDLIRRNDRAKFVGKDWLKNTFFSYTNLSPWYADRQLLFKCMSSVSNSWKPQLWIAFMSLLFPVFPARKQSCTFCGLCCFFMFQHNVGFCLVSKPLLFTFKTFCIWGIFLYTPWVDLLEFSYQCLLQQQLHSSLSLNTFYWVL